MTLDLAPFEAAAATFGLRLEAPKMPWWKNVDLTVLEGHIDGTHVLIQRGFWNWTTQRVYIHASLDPELDLGLWLGSSGMGLGGPMTESDVLGTPAFDNAFSRHVAEPERLASLLTPALQQTLVSWHNAQRWERSAAGSNLAFWVSDESVVLVLEPGVYRWSSSDKLLPTDEFFADIRATVGLARAVGEASRGLAPSALLAPHALAWREFASSRGLGFSGSPLRLHGTFDGIPFSARAACLEERSLVPEGIAVGAARTDPPSFGVEVTMPFSRPLPFYLKVGPSSRWYEFSKRLSTESGAWAEWAPSQSTGDREFDTTFLVVSADPRAPGALLDDELRRALLELQRSYDHVRVLSHSISVRVKSMVPPDSLTDVLRRLAAVEPLLERAARR